MTLKHKVIQDFQFVTSDKKIIVLKSNSILENYTYLAKGSNEVIKIDKEIIENNSLFFKIVDWKEELHSFIKSNKIPQPAILTKKIIPFIDEMFVIGVSKSTPDKTIDNDLLQLETKKKIELLEVKLIEEQTRLTEKEIELSIKEKNFTEKLRQIQNNNVEDLDEIKKKNSELHNLEKKLSELDSKLRLFEIREKNLNNEKNDLLTRLEELESRNQKIKEKEAKLNNLDLEEITLKEINLESALKRLELKERQLKVDSDELMSKEFSLHSREKIIQQNEEELKRKEINLNKKESDLNKEEMNLLDLSNKLQEREVKIKDKEYDISNYIYLPKLMQLVEIKNREMWNETWFEKFFIPKLNELLRLAQS